MDNIKIVQLRGPDRVRKRSVIFFGSEDIAEEVVAFNMLVDMLAQDALNGHCSQITVTQYLDGSLEIQDNGRGIFLGFPGSKDDKYWKELFCELYPGSLYKPDLRTMFEAPSDKNEELAGDLDLCPVQCVCEYMDVWVIRDGVKQSLSFKKGINIGGLTETPCQEHSGTNIRFKLDSEVFTDASIPPQQISEKLQALATQVPGMTTTFRCETANAFEETTFCYPKGVADYMQMLNAGAKTSSIYASKLTAEGQERYNLPRYRATASIAVCFAKDAGFDKSQHNFKELTRGGTHRDIAIKEIRQYLSWMLECKIDEEDLLKHLQLIIVTISEHTEWTNSAKTGLQSIFIRDLTQDTLGGDFQYFVKQNKAFLYDLFNK